MWIGSANSNGLSVYDPDRQVFDSIDPLPMGSSGGAPNIDRLWRDEYGRVWVFVANYGIVLYSAAGRISLLTPQQAQGNPKAIAVAALLAGTSSAAKP